MAPQFIRTSYVSLFYDTWHSPTDPLSAAIYFRPLSRENLNPSSNKARENLSETRILSLMVVSLKNLQQRLEMEVDLELELSVGGSFRKPKMDSDLELRGCDRSEDSKAKREIQAMRRQEAKRKREEKKKGMRKGGGGGGGDAERMRLEAQRLQSRVTDRERRENDEAALSHRKSDIENRNQGLVEGSIQMMVPIQCAYPPRVQYVPFAFPCMVPYWAPAAGIQPVKPIPSRGGRSVLSEGWTNSSPSVSPQGNEELFSNIFLGIFHEQKIFHNYLALLIN